MAEEIVLTLKRACRDTRIKSTSILSINFMFTLLDDFARDRNMYAPILYKTLTFTLIDQFANPDIREELIKNFVIIFKKH
jgi:hypothetical protein